MTFKTAKLVAASIWLGGGLLIAAMLFVQTVFGTIYAGREDDIINWFTPVVGANAGLVIGTLIYDHNNPNPEADAKHLKLWFLLLTISPSVVFLMALIAVILHSAAADNPFGLFKIAALWLGGLQGIITGTLGVLFQKK